MPAPTPKPIAQDPKAKAPALPVGDPIARPVNTRLRAVLFVVLLVAVAAVAGVLTRRALYPPRTASTATAEDEGPKTEQERVEAKLQAMMAAVTAQMFDSPFLEMTPENQKQIEQVSKPYPNATLDAAASSYVESPEEGQVYRMVYKTDDSVDQVKGWYEKDIHPDYRTVHENQTGMKAYTFQVKVPGLKIEREILIFQPPPVAGAEPTTEIWVTIRNSFNQGSGH
ncbi:MAG TPA: hypothetical protein VEI97_14030 [bacterium]|nr:hypothetical protein [bacterium]